MLGFYVVVVDPVAFWQPYMTLMAELVEKNNLQLNLELLTAEVMTLSAVLAFWMLYTVGLLLGYALYKRLPRETSDFGWFRNLNLGRVIAFTMAVTSLLAFIVDVAWLQNLAFVLFVVFWIQGLAIVHWMHAERQLPLAALVAVYALLPFLQVLLMTALAVFGYMDAWFDFRRRLKRA
jgi:uncharacterized protein YybS (DUF2232 family)